MLCFFIDAYVVASFGPLQVLKRQLSQFLAHDQGDGEPNVIESLVDADVALSDASVTWSAKIASFGHHVEKWLASEADKTAALDNQAVTSHSTFGHMQAQMLMSCTCSHSGDASACSLHCPPHHHWLTLCTPFVKQFTLFSVTVSRALPTC